MARLAWFRLDNRWGIWNKDAFTSDSDNQIAIFEKTEIADDDG